MMHVLLHVMDTACCMYYEICEVIRSVTVPFCFYVDSNFLSYPATLCPCGETQTMSHIVESCPLTKLNGGLSQLHTVDEDVVSWLTIYDMHTRRRRPCPSYNFAQNVISSSVAGSDYLPKFHQNP